MYVFIIILTIFSVLLAILFQNNIRNSNIVSFTYLLILSFIFGFRYDVGIDYQNYEYYYIYAADSFEHELGYSTLNFVASSLNLPFYSVTLTVCFLTNFLIYYGCKNIGLKGLYLHLAIVIYASNFMIVSLNVIRQALAVAIAFYYFTALNNSELLRYLKSIIYSSLFHLSASITLTPLYLLKATLSKFHTVVALFLIMNLTFIVTWFLDLSSLFNEIIAFFPLYGESYSQTDFGTSKTAGIGVLSKFLMSFMITSILILYKERFSRTDYLIISLYLIGMSFNYLAVSNFMWGRIGIYFYIYEIVAIPLIISKLQLTMSRTIAFCIAVSYAFIFLSTLLFATEASKLIYKNVFFN